MRDGIAQQYDVDNVIEAIREREMITARHERRNVWQAKLPTRASSHNKQ